MREGNKKAGNGKEGRNETRRSAGKIGKNESGKEKRREKFPNRVTLDLSGIMGRLGGSDRSSIGASVCISTKTRLRRVSASSLQKGARSRCWRPIGGERWQPLASCAAPSPAKRKGAALSYSLPASFPP
eukprot:6176948-Pleurochrysis_carterae.AAC.2